MPVMNLIPKCKSNLVNDCLHIFASLVFQSTVAADLAVLLNPVIYLDIRSSSFESPHFRLPTAILPIAEQVNPIIIY